MKVRLESIGGITGRAGKQIVEIDLSKLDEKAAAELRQALKSIPQNAWGRAFLSEHPKPWDFLQMLTVQEQGRQRSITFHRNEGPPELVQVADKIMGLQ